MKRTLIALAATAAFTLTTGAGVATAAHSHVDTPSGCHETNGNARNGSSTAWTNSAGGHQTAVEAGAHDSEGCD